VVKLFTPDAGATWLLTEIDPDDRYGTRGQRRCIGLSRRCDRIGRDRGACLRCWHGQRRT